MEKITITISNWEKYNPRKDITNGSWIRLNVDVFTSQTLFELTLEEKAAWIFILTQCAKKQGSVELNVGWCEKEGIPEKILMSSIQKLEIIGCLSATYADVRARTQTAPTIRNERNVTRRNGTNADSSESVSASLDSLKKEEKGKVDEQGEPVKVIEEVIGFLNFATKCTYRTSSRANRELIRNLAKAGYSASDMVKVIRHRSHLWGKDPKMSGYMRPSTLFNRSKFEEYLPQAEVYCANYLALFGSEPPYVSTH